jgi:hypothetical protein
MRCEKRGYFTDCNGKKSFGRLSAFWILIIGSAVIVCCLIGYFIEKPGWEEILFSGFGIIGLSAGGKSLHAAFEKFRTVKEPGPQPEPDSAPGPDPNQEGGK